MKRIHFRTISSISSKQTSLLTLVAFGIALFACAVVTPIAHATETAAWVNANVEWQSAAAGSAKSTVVGWENNCTQTFNDNKVSMAGSSQRTIVNASAYLQSTWVTRAGDPPNKTNPTATSGTAVAMQINQMDFLCAILTMNASGFAIAADHQVTNAQYPNDRSPVPDSADAQYKVNQASRFESNSKILSVTASVGTISGTATGKVIKYVRDTTSRYWKAAAIPFTYNVPVGMAPGTHTVTIYVKQTNIQTYDAYGTGGTSRCDSHDVTYNDFASCSSQTEPYQFTFTVAAPPLPYNLDAGVSATVTRGGVSTGSTTAQVGDQITYTYTLHNAGGGPTAAATTCTIYANEFAGNHAVPVPSDTGVVDATETTAMQAKCTPILAANGTVTLTEVVTAGAGDADKTICRSLYATPTTPTGGTTDSEACVPVASSPYLKVFGGDVSAGNGFFPSLAATACTSSNSAIISWNQRTTPYYAGAGTQYAAMALNTITDFASAQGTVTGGASAPSDLAFSNSTITGTDKTGGTFGQSLGTTPCATDYYDEIPATTLPASTNVSSLTGGKAYSSNSDLNGMSGNVNPGQRTVVYVKGNVYISGNITYTGSWNYTNIPLFDLVVKGNIYIAPGVSQLDGVYIAQPNGATGGNIYTCATGLGAPVDPTSANFYSTCNSKLTVNGAFASAQTQFLRTSGTVANSLDNETVGSSDAAEVFNFNPSLWIAQPTGMVAGNTTNDYDSVLDLPPVL